MPIQIPLIIFGILFALLTGYGLFSITAPHNVQQQITTISTIPQNISRNITGNPIEDVGNVVKESPNIFQDFVDMLTAGVTGVASFFSKLIALGLTYVVRYFDPNITIPEWIGLIAFILIFIWLLMNQWGNIWAFMNNNLILTFMILAVVFVLGIALKYLHLI